VALRAVHPESIQQSHTLTPSPPHSYPLSLSAGSNYIYKFIEKHALILMEESKAIQRRRKDALQAAKK
jgi:hypothetical protein